METISTRKPSLENFLCKGESFAINFRIWRTLERKEIKITLSEIAEKREAKEKLFALDI